jgi:uncharacterized protein (DUF1015 family)
VARLRPLRGLRYDPRHVDAGSVLAPPYDVISAAQQEELYARDLRNVVRIDFGAELPGDVADRDDRYTRARGHLDSWLRLGILRREEQPALYVVDHEFLGADGRRHVRRGILGRVPAKPWAESEVLPHERTMRGPKQDRLALMRATRTQTSAVWVVWDRAPGMGAALTAAIARSPDAEGETPGELDVERLRLWVVSDPQHLAAIDAALAPARLYIADGHHRFETAAAYAAERRAAEPDAPEDADFAMTLVYACAADDPVVEVWPTHRLVKAEAVGGADGAATRGDAGATAGGDPAEAPVADAADGGGARSAPRQESAAALTTATAAAALTLAALRDRLAQSGFELLPQPDLQAATKAAARRRDSAHAFGVAAADGAALLTAPRTRTGSPQAGLDVSVLAERVLGDALGITPEQVVGGALAYTRDVAEADEAVRNGGAALAFTCNPTTTAEIIAVSDAGEVMPQKSSYFYPKVPTGLVLSPL